jgi:hypothetical protein
MNQAMNNTNVTMPIIGAPGRGAGLSTPACLSRGSSTCDVVERGR